mgnify:CR=1 FL=1
MPVNDTVPMTPMTPVTESTDLRLSGRMSLEDERTLARAAELLGFSRPAHAVARRVLSWSVPVTSVPNTRDGLEWKASFRRLIEPSEAELDGRLLPSNSRDSAEHPRRLAVA